jgi:hypothetical protein
MYDSATGVILHTGVHEGRVRRRLDYRAKKLQKLLSGSILDLVSDCRAFDATDLQHKIYVLTGLTKPS